MFHRHVRFRKPGITQSGHVAWLWPKKIGLLTGAYFLILLTGCRLDVNRLVVPDLTWTSPIKSSTAEEKDPLESVQIPPRDLELMPPAPMPWRIALVLPSQSSSLDLPALTQGFLALCHALKVIPVTSANLSAALASRPNALCVVAPATSLSAITVQAHKGGAICVFCDANNGRIVSMAVQKLRQAAGTSDFDGFVGTDALSAGRMCGLAMMDLLPNGGKVLAIGPALSSMEGFISITTGQLEVENSTQMPPASASLVTFQGFTCLDPSQMPKLQRALVASPKLRTKPVVGYGDTPTMRSLFAMGRCEGLVAPPSTGLGEALAALTVGLLENRLPKGRQVLLASEGYLRPPPSSSAPPTR
ncbi:hypothetical protein CWRG_02381 [Chthonomonas calidirosea]|uniref:ABC-type sugar transport system, periplasmic component n=1 Tax=Chthonomonas calidirosea (strain DSM 23976 / ICMP 18418 / T49) TaxID=1303518 RepID=S0EZ61_CHTCT|nr:hypothetical protein [Chthonomonas calidirosea]CCW35505.1 hypothetical protein CCALI_01692 [Chthonomonas calidirosea T49]CEK19074.1 hypothetical protein CWRG_02381 [Chthonomonas calidirosea]CEK20071.1 hypothetical protein CTKA_02403 [Chthonomonas calidirosea]